MPQNFDEPCPNCVNLSAAHNAGEVPVSNSCQACGGTGIIPFEVAQYLNSHATDNGDHWLVDYSKPQIATNPYSTKMGIRITVDKSTYSYKTMDVSNWSLPNSEFSGIPENANTVMITSIIIEDSKMRGIIQ